MNKVSNLLSNPAVVSGLRLVAPQLSTTIGLLSAVGATLFAGGEQKTAAHVLEYVDDRIAELIQSISGSTHVSEAKARECEIRIHELLELLFQWDKR